MTPPYGAPLLAVTDVVPAVHVGPVGTLIFASLAIMGSPGPSTISLVAAAVAYGIRRSLTYCVGLVIGTTVVLLAAATGVTAVLLAVPALHWVLLLAAAGYILWLAYHLATARPPAEQTASDRRPSLVDGVVLGVINPKAWIAIAAVFASAQLSGTAVADATLKVPLLTLMVVLIHVMWLLAGRLLMPAMRHRQPGSLGDPRPGSRPAAVPDRIGRGNHRWAGRHHSGPATARPGPPGAGRPHLHRPEQGPRAAQQPRREDRHRPEQRHHRPGVGGSAHGHPRPAAAHPRRSSPTPRTTPNTTSDDGNAGGQSGTSQ